MRVKRTVPPEEIEAMRRELADGDSLAMVGRRRGISHEWVRQLTGYKRSKSRSQANQERVQFLVKVGKTDQQIAEEMKLSKSHVKALRLSAGIKRPNPFKRHTPEHSIWCARKWHELFGYTPGALDWEPSRAIRNGQHDRAERFRRFQAEFDCPVTGTVQQLFGTWSEFIRRTELPPARAGAPGHGRWKIG